VWGRVLVLVPTGKAFDSMGSGDNLKAGMQLLGIATTRVLRMPSVLT
jgi:hypothetical protein